MRRGSHDMQVNVAGIRRNLKNLAHNYSDAQRKVREATSNDPWGPSSTLMAEIADLTYNVVAFTEIMQMIWKRLNDHGKNWRHVYKALVLLEYLIKTGSEKVGQQCKENIFAIQTLKDFQYLEEGKDQGQNVREKAKQLVNILKDEERLRNERARALKAKERFALNASGFGSDGGLDTPSSPKYPAFRGDWSGSRESGELPKELEVARPQTAGEEELQLQLALAMSREEAEQEEQKRRSDDVRLQLALSQSQQDFNVCRAQQEKSTHMVDLLDTSLSDASPVDPWKVPSKKPQSNLWQQNSLSSPTLQQPPNPVVDPWALPSRPSADPWSPTATASKPSPTRPDDPWSPASHGSSTDLDDFDTIMNRNRTSPKTNGANHTTNNGSDPFELNLLGDSLPSAGPSPSTGATKKTPQSFLGENSALVNLDNLVTTTKPTSAPLAPNPFSDAQPAVPSRPVFPTQPPKPSMNEIKQTPFVAPTPYATAMPSYPVGFSPTPTPIFGAGNQFGANGNAFGVSTQPVLQDPWAPVPPPTASVGQLGAPWVKQSEQANPFLS